MELVSVFAYSSDESGEASRHSGDSDASDGDHWLRPTPQSRSPASGPSNRQTKLTNAQKKEAKKQRAKEAAAKKPAAGPKPDLRGMRGLLSSAGSTPVVSKPPSVLSSALSSSIAGGLPGPLLFLRQRSLSSSNLAALAETGEHNIPPAVHVSERCACTC